MRKFSPEEWYIDEYTWCGVDKKGVRWYPISWGDNSTAYAMTQDIQHCMSFGTIKRVEKMLLAENKHKFPLKIKYDKIELVRIKEYPTFYFDYWKIAKQLKIKVKKIVRDNDEIIKHIAKYGFKPIGNMPKIIVVSRDELKEYIK